MSDDLQTPPVGGMRLGPYEIVRPLGEGGMAQVYLALRRGAGGFEKRTVLKVLHSRYIGDKSFVEMFLEEARLLARLHHPNIVDVTEVECIDGVPYLAMEFVDGPTLASLARGALKAGAVRFDFYLHIVRQVCEALRAAHELRIDGKLVNLVHRDVSTQNVMVDAQSGLAKLIDFGVAKANDTQHQTLAGLVKGKIHYLAPEVLAGARPDARNDIYAVGVLLYRLATGRLPFREADLADLAAGKQKKPFVSLSTIVGLPEGVPELVEKALHPDPKARYQTAAELSSEIARVLGPLSVDPQQIPVWIAGLFPDGNYNPPADPSKSSTHTALTRIAHDRRVDDRRVHESASGAQPARIVNASIAVGVTGALSALLALGLLGWFWMHPAAVPSPGPEADAELFMLAAEQLAGRGDFARAIELNERAAALPIEDAEIVVRITEQRSRLEQQKGR